MGSSRGAILNSGWLVSAVLTFGTGGAASGQSAAEPPAATPVPVAAPVGAVPPSASGPPPVSVSPALALPAPGAPVSADGQGQAPSAEDLTPLDLDALMSLRVTTASRFSDRLPDAPSIMSVVTRDELRRFGGLTLNEILQRVPGLTGSTQYFVDRSLVAARGDQTKTNGGHILFLVNGRPTREVMEGGVISDLLEAFPVDILERIEIIKGPGSVLYGSNAFSAVVNLVTRSADRTFAAVRGSIAPGGAVDTSASFAYKHGNFGAVGAAQLHQLPDWPVTYLVPPSQQNLSFAPHVPPVENVSVANRGAGAYLGLSYGGLRLMSSLTEWHSTGFIEGTVSATRLTRQFGDLGYSLAVSPSWGMSFDATITRTTFDEGPFPNVSRDSNEAILEWTNLVELGARDRLSVGVLANHLDGTELYTATVPATVTARGGRFGGALYAQVEHRLFTSLKLIGGFQTNKIGSIPLDTVPRAGAVWTPTTRASLKALYSQAFRAPSLDENLLDNPGLAGNPNLKPEKVATLDLGASFESDRAQLGIDYFHSKITNNIVNLPGPTRAVYFNLGEVIFDGVEAECKYYLSRELFLQGSALYQVNVDGQGTANVSPIPRVGFKTGASYQSRRWTASVFDVSDGPFDHYAAVNPIPGWRHIITVHVRLDVSKLLGLSKSLGLGVFGHANNLANQAIWLPSGFSSVDTVPVLQGRTVFAGLEVSLGRSAGSVGH